MKKALTVSVAVLVLITAVSCAGIGVVATRAALYAARVLDQLRTAEGSAADRDVLCEYYKAHHDEVEAVREYAKAHWNDVPEQYKPALLAINDQLNACDAGVTPPAADSQPAKKTTARALLTALRRAVALYQKLSAAGII